MTALNDELRLLAERVEAATGPDERIEAEIVAALNHALLKPYPPQTDFGPGQRWQFWSLDGVHFLGNEAKHPFKVLPFTASLDAAMQLVPEGCYGAFDPRFMDEEGEVRFYGFIFRPNWPRWSPHGDWVEELKKSGLCYTPALALTAAALRARASIEGGK